MPRKLFLIPMMLVVLALACGPMSPTAPPPATESMGENATEAPPEAPSGEQIFVPNVSAGEDASQVPPTETVQAPPEEATQPPVTGGTPDPQVLIESSATTLSVGQTFTVKGVPVDIGLPYYYLIVRDDGVQDAPPVLQVTYDNQPTLMEGTSQIVEFVSAEASMDSVTFTLRAKAAGLTTVMVTATGEVARPDGVSWGGEGSGLVTITVNP